MENAAKKAQIPPKTANGHSPVIYALSVSNDSPISISTRYVEERLDIIPLDSEENAANTKIIPTYAPIIVISIQAPVKLNV